MARAGVPLVLSRGGKGEEGEETRLPKRRRRAGGEARLAS